MYFPSGIAYTIDPAYETEVKAYLGMPINPKTLLNTGSSLLRLSRKGQLFNTISFSGHQTMCVSQDGYTLETLDIYGVVDGQEKVIIADVNRSFF